MPSAMTILDLDVPADVDELAPARGRVRAWLDAHDLDPLARTDLLAVASEFLLHAIVRSAGVGSVHLHGEVRPDGVRLAVRAAKEADDIPRPIRLPADPLVADGIGRRLVEQCCDALRITSDEDGTLTECWRRRSA